jgi:hypothetical protein
MSSAGEEEDNARVNPSLEYDGMQSVLTIGSTGSATKVDDLDEAVMVQLIKAKNWEEVKTRCKYLPPPGSGALRACLLIFIYQRPCYRRFSVHLCVGLSPPTCRTPAQVSFF